MFAESLVLYLFLGFIIFLILRELVCWYWKINHRLEKLDRIDNNLEYIARLLKAQAPSDIEKKIDKTFEGDDVEKE